ncbi:ABC transporter permease subunit [Parasphingorhabdus flavimaris]|uniref:ABC transporter permease subunit n=1 Tax=Parasphingorhabdus flavimaris TaxID=266812 RepID=A0ABX2N3Z6_9SPHN|nr:ABC transporter permease/substrate-binding protein [Parasphingorhabdus flavimaris]NVD28425.1 ABC transporter permease subunit [Parasphingorhabdus flavimaris]|tara:strand:+ start:3886 stop:5421 length:1536 start_codon:yes stop_codon:yes gene_type:complete
MTEAWKQAFARVPELLAAHVQISVSALVLAMLICLPLAIWASRAPKVATFTLAIASLIQTIPGLALLALFYPLLLGLSALIGGGISAFGFLPALLALTLYALLPILRNAVTGLAGVDPAVAEAADGLGMTQSQKLYLVEAPLAAPTIMAGIRTAAVWTIGAATLSTTVGQPSLGDLIFAGLQTQNWTLVLTGCLFSALLAISVDLLLGLIEMGIRKRRKILVWTGMAVIAAGLLVATLPLMIARDNVVVIGAKGFSEQYILARLIGSRLEEAGYTVRYRDGLGSAVVYQALSEGDIDVYVEYSGTIWTNQMERTDSQPKAAMLQTIAQWTSSNHGVKMLGELGFENTYAFAIRPTDAREKTLKTLDDLARVSSDFNFGTDVEFLERPEWQMVQDAYPIRFKDARSFSPTFMYPALASGEVDVISAFSSDGRIAANNFVVLEDPRGAVPSYEAIMLLAPDRSSDDKFVAALNPLIGAITVEVMREANYMVDRKDDKKTSRQAARWLNEKLRE